MTEYKLIFEPTTINADGEFEIYVYIEVYSDELYFGFKHGSHWNFEFPEENEDFQKHFENFGITPELIYMECDDKYSEYVVEFEDYDDMRQALKCDMGFKDFYIPEVDD